MFCNIFYGLSGFSKENYAPVVNNITVMVIQSKYNVFNVGFFFYKKFTVKNF